MQAGKRYTLFQTVNWTKKYLFIFFLWACVPIIIHNVFHWHWLHLPWQPISLIGIAVAFYLGFKNNSAYERLWEGRKIWGGIVNTSRSFAVMAIHFVKPDTDMASGPDHSKSISRELIYRHIAWLYALTIQMRKLQPWEHNSKADNQLRKMVGTEYDPAKFEMLKTYIPDEDYSFIMSKGNKASQLLNLQTRRLMDLRENGALEHFRHLEMQNLITEMYTLQGKSERIKNFPFPRQYATVNFFFVVLFILLLPFGMMDVFVDERDSYLIYLAIPFSVIASWVFWMMEMIGEYSENPFEGLFNDVPITNIASGIEIDIRQMMEDENIPASAGPSGAMQLLI